MNTVVLTGATGVFGKFLVDELLKNPLRIVLLVRANSQKGAEERVKHLVSKSPKKFSVIQCDLTKENLGLGENEYLELIKNTTHILHAAASTKFTLPLDEARRNNVDTTKVLLDFAKKCPNLKRFGFIGTAFVAGKRTGVILEDEFKHNKGFLNTYEESKYEAERLVRTKLSKFPIVIFRPSLIITPYQQSGHNPVNALTLGLFLARRGFLPILPGNENNTLDVISGTLASQVIVNILLKKTVQYVAYHVTSANNSPQIKDLITLVEGKSKKKLGIRFCGSIDEFTVELRKITRFRPDLIAIYKKTRSFLPELAFPKTFDNRNLLKELDTQSFSTNTIDELRPLLK